MQVDSRNQVRSGPRLFFEGRIQSRIKTTGFATPAYKYVVMQWLTLLILVVIELYTGGGSTIIILVSKGVFKHRRKGRGKNLYRFFLTFFSFETSQLKPFFHYSLCFILNVSFFIFFKDKVGLQSKFTIWQLKAPSSREEKIFVKNIFQYL